MSVIFVLLKDIFITLWHLNRIESFDVQAYNPIPEAVTN